MPSTPEQRFPYRARVTPPSRPDQPPSSSPESASPGSLTPRTLLRQQLDLVWTFAEHVVIGQVDEELALWEPSAHVATVHRTPDGWHADWPDDENPPIPNPTVGWILWHIEWWWTSTLGCVEGRPPLAPEEHRWSGGTDRVAVLKRAWDAVLETDDLDRPVTWLMPEPQPLGVIAAWVNFELTKNISEISQLKLFHANLGR